MSDLAHVPSRRILCCLLAAALLGSTALPLQAEPARVDNGATAPGGVVATTMNELWRAGGEDDDIFFGAVGRVTTDHLGNVVVLDGQLSEAHVYSPDGEHLQIIGKEGDGPGEVRRPGDVFVTDDGTFCLLQGFPGRVVKLTADGLPAGDATFGDGSGAQGQFAVMVRGFSDPGGMTLAGIRMVFGGGSASTQTYFLARCDDDAQQQHALLEKVHTIDYADFAMDELEMDFVWSRAAVDPAGRVFAAPERNGYAINVWSPDGELERIFSREYTPLVRNQARRDVARKIIEGVGANYPTPPRRITIEDIEADITGMWALADGELWVQTSRGDAEPPAGAWTVLDVFDNKGTFLRQLALSGDHNPLQDALFVLPDRRVVVVTGALDAFLNQMAVGADEAAADEAVTLEVICYELAK